MTALALVAAAVAGMTVFLLKARWNYLQLPSLPKTSAAARDVTVVIPARNEEGKIGRAVSSFTGVPVVVVNDGSTDATVDEARKAGADVISAPSPTDGWLGKPNACWHGAREVDTDWLLFVDADTWFDPRFLDSALAYAQAEQLDLLTVFPLQVRKSLAEKALLPYAFALYFAGVNARRINSPDSPEALANGQCLLFRRSAYNRIGGHAAVAGSVIEDVAFARLAKRNSLRMRVLRAEELASVRMYDSLRCLWRGFQKNSFRFLQVNPVGGTQVILASIALASYAPALLWLLAQGLWPAALLLLVLPSFLLTPWYGGWRQALLAPGAIYLFQAIALNAMLTTLTGRKSVWKGREV